jgi:hypothetical protein
MIFNRFMTLLKQPACLPIALACLLNAGSASALPINSLNLRQIFNSIAQGTQPDVIIDDSGSGTPPPPPNSGSTNNGDTSFSCEFVNGEYTVMYRPESQPSRSYPWAIPSQLGGGWTPEKRCDEITRRFESYRQDGLLELSTGSENGYNTICVTTQIDPSDCRIVLTVPPGQDAQLTRDLVFENLLTADDGQQTQGVYTYSDGRQVIGEIGEILERVGLENAGKIRKIDRTSPKNIDLRPFLDPADGGTGAKLKKSRANAPQRTNPSSSERKPSIFR